MTIELDADTALVLFELLSRFDETDRLQLDDPSETFALWRLHGAMERSLAVQFHPEYGRLVVAARKALRIAGGAED